MVSRRLFGTRFIKFAIVGGAGTITNLAIFFFFADFLNFYPLFVSVLSFCVSVTQNYLFNAAWTFSDTTGRKRFSLRGVRFGRRYFLFVSSSLIGLGVNVAILYTLSRFFSFPLKTIPQAIGILCGMVANFTLAKTVVFKEKSTFHQA
jgi:putative flippase GtrA